MFEWLAAAADQYPDHFGGCNGSHNSESAELLLLMMLKGYQDIRCAVAAARFRKCFMLCYSMAAYQITERPRFGSRCQGLVAHVSD